VAQICFHNSCLQSDPPDLPFTEDVAVSFDFSGFTDSIIIIII
jgi:hypothetical protein